MGLNKFERDRVVSAVPESFGEYGQGIIDIAGHWGLWSCLTTADRTVAQTSSDIHRLYPQVAARAGQPLSFLDRLVEDDIADQLRNMRQGDGQKPRQFLVPATKHAKALIGSLQIVSERQQSMNREDGGVWIAFFFRRIEHPKTPNETILRTIYNFTQAEARLAIALFNGHTIQTAARGLGVSPETVRTQLRGVFRKTRTSRQSDLIRVMYGLAGIFL